MPSLLADARGGVFILPLPCPAEKGSGMTRKRTLHLAALPGTLAAAVLVACAVASLAVSGEADAAFPGKNGRIAYNSGGVIYTIDPDGSAKTKVTNTRVSGYPIDYSPSGKTITYTSYEGFNDGKDTGPQKDAEIYTVNVGGGGRTNVTNNNRGDEAASYSPEGKRIAYTHWDGHDLEIYTINTDGTGELQVTDNRTNEFTPSYSPTARRSSSRVKTESFSEATRSRSTRSASTERIGSNLPRTPPTTTSLTTRPTAGGSPTRAPAKRARTSTRLAPAEEIRSNSRRATILTTRPTVRRSSTTQAMAQMGGSIRSTWAVGVSLESRRAPTLPGGSARSGFSSGQSQRPRGLGWGV